MTHLLWVKIINKTKLIKTKYHISNHLCISDLLVHDCCFGFLKKNYNSSVTQGMMKDSGGLLHGPPLLLTKKNKIDKTPATLFGIIKTICN